jgi:hypothetical protein
MKWYIAKIVFQIIIDNDEYSKQFDEQIRLLLAESNAIAFSKAQCIAKEEEDVFLNSRQQQVQWKFINVEALYEIGELIDGMELYSRINEYDEPLHYVNAVHKKAAAIPQYGEYKIEELL